MRFDSTKKVAARILLMVLLPGLMLFSCVDPQQDPVKQPLYFGKFLPVPVHQVIPRGWLKQYLVNQRDGLTGHLEEAGYPFSTAGWGKEVKDSSSWWPYEQTGYWIDGMLTAGYLLKDSFLLKKAKQRIYPVLSEARQDHYIGPDYLRPKKNKYRWVHAVYFRALMTEYEVTGDKKILQQVRDFHLGQEVEHYLEIRDQLNIENILWAYQHTGDTALYALAAEIYDKMNYGGLLDRPVTAGNFLKQVPVYEHGVTYNENAKLGAILYMSNGDTSFLAPSVSAYQNLDKFNMMVDGVNVSSEHLRTPPHALQTHETCDIADLTWSVGYLLMATGEAKYADKIERAVFNAAPGAVTPDFKALQYLSGPNQVVLDSTSNHNKFFKGNAAMMYAPNAFTECCPGNVNRIMPNYAARLWMRDKDQGVVAAMFGPSEWQGLVKGVKTRIIEDTRYPFTGRISFEFQPESPVRFPFSFRIPGWCDSASVMLNNEPLDEHYETGELVVVDRTYKAGDRLTLDLAQKVTVSHWPEQGVAVERGPLVYSLKIQEDWRALEPAGKDARSSHAFPAYHLYADSEWNYALVLEEGDLKHQVEVIHRDWNDNPWSIDTAPIALRVPARKVPSWKIIRQDTVFYAMNVPQQVNRKTRWREKSDFQKTGDFSFTPPLPVATDLTPSMGPLEMITMVPYGSTKLRITIFPQVQ